MLRRTLLPTSLLLLLLSACAMVGAAKRDARFRDLLDQHRIEKPLAEVWPEAMRVVADRGFQPVGKDRAAVNLPPQGTWESLVSKGHETRRLGGTGLVLETNQDGEGRRYRIEGRPDGAAASRVRFIVVQKRGDIASEETSLDPDALLELVRRVDPEAAARILEEAGKN